MTSLSLSIVLGIILTVLIFSCIKFYKEKQYRIMVGFTILGLIIAYYFKGLTDAKLALGGGIGVEGFFMAATVMIVFLLNGMIGQFVSIYLKKSSSKNNKIMAATGGIFVVLSSLLMLVKLL